jgi:NlpC/P60 family protein
MKAWMGALLLLALLLPLCAAKDEDVSKLNINGMTSKVTPRIQKMLDRAVDLSQRDLNYLYGVADPKRGFDCSGFVFHLLLQMGAPNVPRQANTLYEYLDDKDALISARDPDDLDELESGDLLFWTGTYDVDRSVTHVMIYLGFDPKTRQRWMVGAASKRLGIGVFRFNPGSGSGFGRKFIGFGKVKAFFESDKVRPPAPPAKAVVNASAPLEDASEPERPSRSENTFFQRP